MEIKLIGATLISKEEYKANNIQPSEAWWWTRTADKPKGLVRAVYNDGIGASPTKFILGVVPVLILQKKMKCRKKIRYAGYTFTVLKDGIAICDRVVKNMPFREDWQAVDASLYDVSDVKIWLDSWFSANGDIAEIIED